MVYCEGGAHNGPKDKDAANAYLGVEVEKEAEAAAAPADATATVAAPAPAAAAAAEAPPAATPSEEATSDVVAATSSSSKADRPPRRKQQKAKQQPRPAAQQPPPTPAQPATADDFGGGGGDGGPAGELARFRKLAARDSSGEPFRSLSDAKHYSRGGAYVTIQRRSNWEASSITVRIISEIVPMAIAGTYTCRARRRSLDWRAEQAEARARRGAYQRR